MFFLTNSFYHINIGIYFGNIDNKIKSDDGIGRDCGVHSAEGDSQKLSGKRTNFGRYSGERKHRRSNLYHFRGNLSGKKTEAY